jgi:hypothetical protein
MPKDALRQSNFGFSLLQSAMGSAIDFGAVGLRSRITLFLRSENNYEPTPMKFVADSGASYSFINFENARRLDISMELKGTEFELYPTTAVGPSIMTTAPAASRHGGAKNVKATISISLSCFASACRTIFLRSWDLAVS